MNAPALDVLRRALDAARPEDYAAATNTALADLEALVQAAQACLDEGRVRVSDEHWRLIQAVARVKGETP